MKLLVLVHNEFNDMELVSTLSVLDRTKEFEEITFYNPNISIATGQHKIVNLKLVDKFDIKDYDAIFIPGGRGCQHLRLDRKSIEVIKKFKENDKYIFAICDAPNVLYENGIIDDETVYSSYPIHNIEENSGKERNKAFASAQDKIITGKSPAASATFALLIIKLLFGETKYEAIKKDIYGLHEPEER